MKQSHLVLLSFFFGLMPAFFFGCEAKSSKPEKKLQVAPSFQLPYFAEKDQVFDLSKEVEQTPVLLAFWATWCPSCVQEVPILNKWQQKYADKGQLKIVGVNVKESQNTIETFLKKYPAKYPILLDQDGEVAEKFGILGLPVVVFLAKGGEIIYYGFSLPADVEALISAGNQS